MIRNVTENESCPACIDDSGLVSLRRVVTVNGVRYIPWASGCRWCEKGVAKLAMQYRLPLSNFTAPLDRDYAPDEVEPEPHVERPTLDTPEYAEWRHWASTVLPRPGSRERVAAMLARWRDA